MDKGRTLPHTRWRQETTADALGGSMKTFANIACLLLLAATTAHANNIDKTKASVLRDVCKNWAATAPEKPTKTDDIYHQGVCAGFMAGWYWGVEGSTMPDDKGFLGIFTFEDGVTNLQLAKVFVLYMDSHPEDENKPAHVALLRAVTNAGLYALASPGKDNAK